MGKVRIELVKRASKELVGKYPERFTADFEENKQFLKEINFTSSKKIRNRVAGYITRIMKAEIKSAESAQAELESKEIDESQHINKTIEDLSEA